MAILNNIQNHKHDDDQISSNYHFFEDIEFPPVGTVATVASEIQRLFDKVKEILNTFAKKTEIDTIRVIDDYIVDNLSITAGTTLTQAIDFSDQLGTDEKVLGVIGLVVTNATTDGARFAFCNVTNWNRNASGNAITVQVTNTHASQAAKVMISASVLVLKKGALPIIGN